MDKEQMQEAIETLDAENSFLKKEYLNVRERLIKVEDFLRDKYEVRL